ncbi:TolC family protein, partial [Escherichia coli]|nr:TolC family protein [Escherichia coli]
RRMVKLQRSKIAFALLASTLSLPTYAISIEQAWQQAKQNDTNYEKAKIGVQLGEVGVQSSRRALLPGLSASASADWNESSCHSNSYGATLSQTIWDSSLWSELDQANANYLKAQLELSQSHNELAQKLLTAYL